MKTLTHKDEALFPKSSGAYSNRVFYFQGTNVAVFVTNVWSILDQNTNYLFHELENLPIKLPSKFLKEYRYDMFDK